MEARVDRGRRRHHGAECMHSALSQAKTFSPEIGIVCFKFSLASPLAGTTTMSRAAPLIDNNMGGDVTPHLRLSNSSASHHREESKPPFSPPLLQSRALFSVATIGRRRRRHYPQQAGPRVPSWPRRNMGQDESTIVDDSVPPQSLSARTLPAVAEYIQSGRGKKIVVLTGAGISTAAGSTLGAQSPSLGDVLNG